MKPMGTVYLVGAGPGAPGLLTLRGAELLGRAEVVVYDALVNRELLRLAPPTAEFIFGGKRAAEPSLPQEQLNSLLMEKARQGKCVVRLKGGDPYIFGRGGEEAEELAAAGIPFEVVPGVSSFVAVPSYAGIPLTHRAHCSSFSVLTGHEDPEKPESLLDYAQIAQSPGTKVFMMSTRRVGHIAEQLMAHGVPPETPISLVSAGTTGQQACIEGTLATIGKLADQAALRPPSITVVGDVVKLRGKLNWFEHRPLFGQRVVVTRARDQASEWVQSLRELGAEVLEVPTIKTAPPDEYDDLKDAMLGIGQYDWIVFTSANGVDRFFEYFFATYGDLRCIGGVRLAAVGPATAARIEALHLKVDVVPPEALGRKIAEAIARHESVENLKILLPRAQGASGDLPCALEALGAIVDDVPFYKTVAETDDASGAAQRLQESGAEWITFTSASTVENFHQRFDLPALMARFPKMRLASIGPETTKALSALGVRPALEASPHTTAGLTEALQHAPTGGPKKRV